MFSNQVVFINLSIKLIKLIKVSIKDNLIYKIKYNLIYYLILYLLFLILIVALELYNISLMIGKNIQLKIDYLQPLNSIKSI